MITNEKDVLQELKNLRLSEKSRAIMRSELSAYADLHAVLVTEATSFNSMAFLGSIFSHSRALMAGALSLILVVAGGGVTAYASEKTVPGDALYPIKIHVTEPVAAAFTGGGSAKARFHATLALKRVQEAEVLEQRGGLTEEKAKELAVRFSDEADKAEAEADRLESHGDYGASLAIRTELASELKLHVGIPDATVSDAAASIDVVATARSAKSAKSTETPATMKAVSESSQEMVDDTHIDFKQVVAHKVARLLEVRARSQALATDDRNDGGGVTLDSDEEDSDRKTASRGLLSGASVSADVASSTASSSPKEGARLLKALLKEKHTEQDDSDAENELDDDDSVLGPGTVLEPVQNPLRLVPTRGLIRD